MLNNFRCARGAEYRHGGRKGCLKGTRRAVLSGIELWARDFDRTPVYWLNGLAGTGKSTIAKTVAERLFADGQLGASFFCSRDFEDQRNLQLIFPTLAVQLARKYTEFRSIFTPLIQSDPDITYESLYDQMEKLIVRPLNEANISTVIVIDALDECEDEEPASAILSVLGRLASEIPKVKFFLTGRPESRISVGFRLPLLAKMTDVFVLHEVEPDQVRGDIQLFFKTGFSELADRQDGLDDWPTVEQLDGLCQRAAGLFVYAAATLKFIDNNKWDPRKRLNTLLQSQKIGDYEGETLDSLYTSILREAFGNEKPEYDAKICSVLGAVVLTANPLSPSSIAMLLEFDTKDVPLLLSSVNSLLILQEDANHPVRPFHKSFPDFITDPSRCTNPRFYISPSDHHAQLLIGCLNLMSRALEKNMCKLPDGVANSDVGDLKERTKKYIDPALRYACLSWHTHLIDLDATPDHTPTITPTLHRFLETKFLFWLEVLSVLGAARNAVAALQATTDWLEVCQVSTHYVPPKVTHWIQETPTLDLANDCFRFVTGYFEIISTSSPHIYHSALVVAPKDSIVRKLYESHTHPFIRVVCGGPMLWDGTTAAATRPFSLESVALSPCDRFIAITWYNSRLVDVLDPVTLQRLQTLEIPQDVSTQSRVLVFSPDSRILTCTSGSCLRDDLFVVSWDLQTGGVSSVIRWPAPGWDMYDLPSVTYSANGKMVGVSHFIRHSSYKHSDIFICDVASGMLMHSYSLDNTVPLSNHIWIHGESLRFATADATTITVWEVQFTSGATPTEVETAPAPDGFSGESIVLQFLPDPSRLVFAYLDQERVLVWDVRNSIYLLEFAVAKSFPWTTFSSNGRFFACQVVGSTYLWKECPAGYTLLGIVTSSGLPLLAGNGESFVTYSGCTIQSWRTRKFTTTPSSILTQASRYPKYHILEFSPDERLAVVAKADNTVTVLNLKSGVPQLTVDPSMDVYGVGVVGNAAVVIGSTKIVSWNLPAEDFVPNARVGVEGSSRTITLGDLRHDGVVSASISPDSRYIALAVWGTPPDAGHIALHIYNASTGEHLGGEVVVTVTLRFSPDGRDVWCANGIGQVEVWRVGDGQEVLKRLMDEVDMEHPPEGNPWGSSCGYRLTKDWWILGPDGKRLLMLPPPWQSYAADRVWKGQFLALLHRGLPEPVILELEVNHDDP